MIKTSLVVLLLFLVSSTASAQGLAELATPQSGRSKRATSAHRSGSDGEYDPSAEVDPDSNLDRQDLEPGKTRVLLEADGPGVITHIWMTFLGPQPQGWAPNGAANHQEMLLRIYYDGSDRPAVEAPIGDFFANAFGKRSEVISVPVVVEDADSYNCFWHMPFRKSIRIEVVNQSEKMLKKLYYNIDWIKKDELPADTPYFYAQYKQEYPVKQGQDYVILDTEGKGHYVGTVLSVRMRSPAWFGEGDEKIYIDGEQKPSIWGTGTEDYFLSAWGLKQVISPYFGTPFFDQRGPGGHVSSYRWHIGDPIVFDKSIRVTIEHYGWMSPDENPEYRSTSWNERQDDYSSVAFWYQTGTPTFDVKVPHARERALPNLDKIFYATDMLDKIKHGDGSTRKQEFDILPKGHMLYKPETQENARLTFPFTVENKEPVRLVVRATQSYDFGIYKATLNGVPIGRPMNLYSPKTKSWDYALLDFWPEPGEYTLQLECVGKAPQSSGHRAAIESVRLRERRPRVKEMAHDRDKDWREDPLLY